MNAKQRMIEVLVNKNVDIKPVTPHWWGLYKFQLGGLIDCYDDEVKAWGLKAEDLVTYDELFYNTFKPDMFHLTTSCSRLPLSATHIEEIRIKRKKASELSSKADIDSYLKLISRTEKEVEDSGELDHIKYHSKKYGDDVLLSLNEGSDVACFFDTHVGFENGLIGLLEEPELVAYYLKGLYNNTLERMKVYKKNGGHAFINSETYCSSDIISPQIYKDIIFPVHKEFYKSLSDMGILPICYFTGNILPIIDSIKELPINGIMVEASKKGFDTDIGKISKALEGEKALFGNLESHYILERGSVQDVIHETKLQLEKTRNTPFIMANDCPISFNTPKENISAMLEVVRK